MYVGELKGARGKSNLSINLCSEISSFLSIRCLVYRSVRI